MTLLAEGFADSRKLAFAWDYFQRRLPPGKAPAISVAAEMIYWERPGGGRVFHAGSINAGSTLASSKWTGLIRNVLTTSASGSRAAASASRSVRTKECIGSTPNYGKSLIDVQ